MAKDQSAKAAKPAEDEAKKKAREARKAERAEAKKRVLQFLADNKDELGDDLIKDVMLFVGKPRAARKGGTRASVNQALRTALLEAGDQGLSEMDVFKMFKIGRPEMVTKIRILVLTPNPDDRVWVKFFEDDEVYRVVGTGPEPPKGWDGYVPSDKESL